MTKEEAPQGNANNTSGNSSVVASGRTGINSKNSRALTEDFVEFVDVLLHVAAGTVPAEGLCEVLC